MSKTINLEVIRTYRKDIRFSIQVPEKLKGDKLVEYLKSPEIMSKVEVAVKKAKLMEGSNDFHYFDTEEIIGSYIK